MEFKLNKIDTDIRKRIQEERKSGKVHSSKSININKDYNDDKENAHQLTKENLKQEKRFINIDGVKYCGKQIKIKAEKTEKIDVLNSSGRILDTKK